MSALERLDGLLSGGGGATGKTVQRRYEGADRGPRTGNMPLNNLSANQDIGAAAVKLRQRAKWLYQNTVYAKRAVRTIANGMVGTGIVPTFKSKNEAAVKRLKECWEQWAEESCADFYDRLDFYGIQKLVAITYKRDGECLIMRRRVPISESPNGIQLQVLEMEYLADYINYQILPGGGWTRNGIEYDHRGKARYYWLFKRHPAEWWTQPEKYSVEDVIHVMDVEYPAQNRGVTEGAQTIIEENELDMYEDAELVGKKVQASHALFRVTNDPEKMADEPDPNDYDSTEDMEKIEPGTIYHLFPGETIVSNTPPTANGTEDYRRSKQRNIAAGWGVTYEAMTGDYSMVNFSSGRMGWIEGGRNLEDWQWRTLIPQLCKRVMGWFLEQVPVMEGGLVKLPADMEITWTVPKREMLDPVKETNGLKNQLRTGLISLSEAIKSRGDNPEDVLEAIKRDVDLCKKLGLNLEWSPNLDADIATPAKIKGEASK